MKGRRQREKRYGCLLHVGGRYNFNRLAVWLKANVWLIAGCILWVSASWAMWRNRARQWAKMAQDSTFWSMAIKIDIPKRADSQGVRKSRSTKGVTRSFKPALRIEP